MIQAFQEYTTATLPSSVLSETVDSIEQGFLAGGQAFIGYMERVPVARVRFKLSTQGIYFFKLSVIPERQGLTKVLLAKQFALTNGKKTYK